jgi:hypothetical protein
LQNVTYAAGKHGDAIVVGAASAVRFPPAMTWNGASITIEAWVRPAQAGIEMVVLDVDQRYAMRIRDNGELRCQGASGAVDGGSVPAGVFTHVACVFVNGNVGVYTAGVLRDVEGASMGSALGTGTAIGSDAPSGTAFSGAIDSLRIFNVARSSPDIAADAQQ